MKIVGVLLGAAFVAGGLAAMSSATKADTVECYDGNGRPIAVMAKACVGGVIQQCLPKTYGKGFSLRVYQGKPQKCGDSPAK